MNGDFWTLVLLCLAAFAAGAVNSVAGGGTLLTFPALVAALGGTAEAAVVANGTSTLALMPGSVAGAWGYRREVSASRRWLRVLIVPSLLGGVVGTALVVALVPWLILAASLLFLAQKPLTRWLQIGHADEPNRHTVAGVAAFQFLVAVYGGYFGAGIGILMLSSLAFMGLGDIHRMNALKTLLAACINGTSVVLFAGRGLIHWRYAAVMAVASVAGGYLGARVARRLSAGLVRGVVVVIGLSLAGYEFYKRLG
jgi:uncharacterized protein